MREKRCWFGRARGADGGGLFAGAGGAGVTEQRQRGAAESRRTESAGSGRGRGVVNPPNSKTNRCNPEQEQSSLPLIRVEDYLTTSEDEEVGQGKKKNVGTQQHVGKQRRKNARAVMRDMKIRIQELEDLELRSERSDRGRRGVGRRKLC